MPWAVWRGKYPKAKYKSYKASLRRTLGLGFGNNVDLWRSSKVELSASELLCFTANNLQSQSNVVDPALGVNFKVTGQQRWV